MDEAVSNCVNRDRAKRLTVTALDQLFIHGMRTDHHPLKERAMIAGETGEHRRVVFTHEITSTLGLIVAVAENFYVEGEAIHEGLKVLRIVSFELSGDDGFDRIG